MYILLKRENAIPAFLFGSLHDLEGCNGEKYGCSLKNWRDGQEN